MTDRINRVLWLSAAGCIILSLLNLGTLSCASLNIIAIWIIIMLNRDYTSKEIARLKSEIWALKSRIR